MNARPADVDAYLAALPDDARRALTDLRRTIREAVPDAVESISYAMPTYKYRGRPLIYFGAARKHCAIYGMSAQFEAHAAELAAYDLAKGTLRFPPSNPLPPSLIQALLRDRIVEIEAAEAVKRPRGRPTRSG